MNISLNRIFEDQYPQKSHFGICWTPKSTMSQSYHVLQDHPFIFTSKNSLPPTSFPPPEHNPAPEDPGTEPWLICVIVVLAACVVTEGVVLFVVRKRRKNSAIHWHFTVVTSHCRLLRDSRAKLIFCFLINVVVIRLLSCFSTPCHSLSCQNYLIIMNIYFLLVTILPFTSASDSGKFQIRSD